MDSQQRPRKRRRKSHSRNIHRIILGLSLISVISICAVRLFYKNRSAPPPSSDSDCIVIAADGNSNASDTPTEDSTDADLLQTLQTLKKQEPKYRTLSITFRNTPPNSSKCYPKIWICWTLCWSIPIKKERFSLIPSVM